ncbi:MAG: DEAD/DEAH box helicase [Verrucomicrobia bacterium]|nr:DEAD/DEAH box helicase [Verrucomicrobiota bacterium]MDA1005870.1 DEAD/DEAH box helicase [Verrucomicrobiota bacterium]
MTPNTFEALPLAAPIQRALTERNYTIPSPIQAQAIPHLLEGRDLLGCAQTGTGKTAAFSLPILQLLHSNPQPLRPKSPRVLVLTPTRELATQVGKSLETYGAHLRMQHALVFGGVGQRPQVNSMRNGVDVLVACPGRLEDLIQQRYIDLSSVEFFVLDEADRMLDMGFLPAVKRIVAMLPRKRQSLFFSATLPPSIVELSHNILRDPVTVTIAPETTTAETVEQRVCFVERDNKRDLLLELLAKQKPGELALVFSRTKHGSDKLSRYINKAGITAEAIHGNRSQPQRDKTLDRFRSGKFPVLVATDVAARGVDVKSITLVVNFDLPNEPEAYVHRIGRTGRAGASGHAVSFCATDEREYLRDIEKLIQQKIAVDDAHQWHAAGLAEQHALGQRSGLKKVGNPGRGNNGGGGRPAGRSSQRRRRSGGSSRRRVA